MPRSIVPSAVAINGPVPSSFGTSLWPYASNEGRALREPTLNELRSLQREAGYPLVSVSLATAPDVLVGPEHLARIEVLLHDARQRLMLEFDGAQADFLLDKLRERAALLRGQRTSHGIVLFGSERICRTYRVASRIEDRVVIDPTFATRDLARSLALNPRYRLLLLTQDSARLLVGSGEHLTEVNDGLFPALARLDERGRRKRAGDREKKELHDVATFVRQVTVAFKAHSADEDLPLVAVASTAMRGMFKSSAEIQPIGMVVGSYEKASIGRLSKLARPVIDAHLGDLRARAIERFDEAVGARQAAVGINHVWSAAQREMIDTLLVDESFRFPAWTTLGGRNLVRAFTPESPDVLDDAVDEVIEMVQRVDARVCFVRPGELGADKIAAVLARKAS